MAFTDPRNVFGIHSILPYSRTTGIPYGLLRVVQGGEISLSGETIDLYGGSSRFPWASEVGDFDSEFKFTCSEYPDFLFQLFLGASVTTSNADTDGSVGTLTDIYGGTVVDATTGIASVAATVGAEASLKYGRYIVVATSDDDFDIYAHSNIDASKGTDLVYISDAMKVTATPLAMGDTGATVVVADLGVTFTGGSGTVSMTTGHTAYFDVLPIHTGRSKIDIGQAATAFPEFGARMMACKRGTFEIFEVHAYRAIGNGMPVGFTRNEWAEPELTMKLLRDSTQDLVFTIEAVKGTS